MTNIVRTCSLVLASHAVALSAFAGEGGTPVPPTIEKSGRSDNSIYVGINWNFGLRTGATAVLGYRDARVKSNGNVDGFKVEATWVLSGAPMGFGEIRAKYLKGERNVQGEVGLGFSGAHEAFLIHGGVQGPYVNGGVDYLFDKGWLASIGVNSLNKVKKPRETQTCPIGTILQGDVCVPDNGT